MKQTQGFIFGLFITWSSGRAALFNVWGLLPDVRTVATLHWGYWQKDAEDAADGQEEKKFKA